MLEFWYRMFLFVICKLIFIEHRYGEWKQGEGYKYRYCKLCRHEETICEHGFDGCSD